MSQSQTGRKGRLEGWKQRVRQLKSETYTLYLAYRDPRVPWYAKAFAALVVAYAFSPLDLIPDFVPILGYLDDLLLVPLGIVLALKMIPPEVLEEHRAEARLRLQEGRPVNRTAAVIIVALWILTLALVALLTVRALR